MLQEKNYAHLDGDRLKTCVVFFAVRKDVDKIQRKDFKRPKREDKYGTSVMSIQFSKQGRCTVSIKNRYNHTVNNPDATYGNDLDRIVPGLTQSFEELLAGRGLSLNSDNVERLEIPNYVVASDGKYYKYNIEVDGIYYCPGNVIIDRGQIIRLDPEKQELIDCFILDKETKTLRPYEKDFFTKDDSFLDDFKDIQKIQIDKDKEKKTRIITVYKKTDEKPIRIEIDKDNQIIGYSNENLKKMGSHFLSFNKGLKSLDLPNVEEIDDWCLNRNEELETLSLPKVRKILGPFMPRNQKLSRLNLPNVEEIGGGAFILNRELTELILPKLRIVRGNFFKRNQKISRVYMPNLEEVGDSFLASNQGLTELILPKVQEIGNDFLFYNQKLGKLELPSLVKAGNNFLRNNEALKRIELQNLEELGECPLYNNLVLEEAIIPKSSAIVDLIMLGHPIPRVDSKGIAELDRDSQFTTTEVGLGRRIINKIKEFFRGR